jgi:hypothetical protein
MYNLRYYTLLRTISYRSGSAQAGRQAGTHKCRTLGIECTTYSVLLQTFLCIPSCVFAFFFQSFMVVHDVHYL